MAAVDLIGRKPLFVTDLTLDYCANTYGVAPCTATGSAGGECYNCRKHCQDSANFNPTTKTYTLCQPRADLPKGVPMYPVIVGELALAPIKAPVFGVGDRGSITIRYKDFPHNDIGVDPYYATRLYTPLAQGTFFSKLLARNPYYIGRTLTVKVGYISDPFTWFDFESRTYIIDKIEGPNANGDVTITASDILRLADDDVSQVPAQSEGTLNAALTDSATSLALVSGQGAAYASAGHLRIGEEYITYTGKSTDTFTGLTRGAWGTTAKAHDAGDAVQQCKAWESVNVIDIIFELLNTYGGIAETSLPYDEGQTTPTGTNDDWDDIKEDWLSLYNLTTIIGEPTGINTLLKELTEQCSLAIFADPVANKVKLITNTPPLGNASVTEITDDANILDGSLRKKEEPKLQYTRAIIAWDKIDFSAADDFGNFRSNLLSVDLTAEDSQHYAKEKVKTIKSRWFSAANAAQVSDLVTYIRTRLSDTPVVLTFKVDAKDGDLEPGDLIDITTRMLTDETGAAVATRMQIISKSEAPGIVTYDAVSFSFTGASRYAFIAPDSLSDYSAESDANKRAYAFICLDTGYFSDGTEGYVII